MQESLNLRGDVLQPELSTGLGELAVGRDDHVEAGGVHPPSTAEIHNDQCRVMLGDPAEDRAGGRRGAAIPIPGGSDVDRAVRLTWRDV